MDRPPAGLCAPIANDGRMTAVLHGTHTPCALSSAAEIQVAQILIVMLD
ncbi:MAG TPA: hypothetical protein VIX86_22380 [Streptosporangiaceae bacterium]